MIYDKLSNIEKYLGMTPNLDTAIRFLASQDLNSLPLGKTVIDGDLVFANVMEADAAPGEEREFELHRNYMDIQIDLMGVERIEIGDSASMELTAYHSETDFGTVKCPAAASCVLGPGNFILCMISEPHKPGILHTREQARLKKCVVKVRRQQEPPFAAEPQDFLLS